MKASAKLVGIALAVAIVALAVYGYAAMIQVQGVDKLGAGQGAVNAPPDVTDVKWILKADDQTYVDKVELTFSAELSAGSDVYVQLRNDQDVIISRGHTNLSEAAKVVTVDVEDVQASQVYKIDVTVIEPVP